jgi:biopolymer transport protein ExbD
MFRFKSIHFITLTIFLSAMWILLFNLHKPFLPNYHIIIINVPKDEKSQSPFSSYYILDLIKAKKKIHVELDDDRLTNQKKISFIQYEARKLKYTKDTNSVVNISITDEVLYSEIMQLMNICIEDGHKRYVLLKKKFVIFGEYPSIKNTTKKVEMIYL